MKRYVLFSVLLAIFFSACIEAEQLQVKTEEASAGLPMQIVLTWQQDPSTTMTITWRADGPDENPILRFADDPEARSRRWTAVTAHSFTFDETEALLHTVELTGLEPDMEYYVVIENPFFPESFSFRTLPAHSDEREIVFLAGGDSRSRRDVRREMNRMATSENPDFIIFAGDYISGPLSEREWDEWFDDWHELLITEEGRRIPIITAIGNHEVHGGFFQTPDKAPYFYNRFISPQPRNYYALELTPDLVLITLDSDHTMGVPEQVQWLEKTLAKNHDKKWKLVQYHVAAWPSVRNMNDTIPRMIREHWVPLFEKYNVNLVIEAHDHAFKKTVPIRDNQRDDEHGVIYIGDGGWGAPIRQTKDPAMHWWLDEAFAADHFWKLTLSKDATHLRVEPVFRPPARSFVLGAE
ncbi:MAG: metallophosphoesterase family protein [Bacteroidetes bacterium]|nr:MAG: metallophosphoesterase family protein [Bacteroidota bacterium]